jgi:signal transduction histidine kinase
MLRGPLDDPGLRLAFRRAETREWVDADGAPLESPRPEQQLTEIERDGQTVAEIVHDKQLAEDPELLRVAGAVSLLALENAELEAAWEHSLRALAESRARLTKASDRERRKLERDLHDGAQQRILGALLRLSLADELAGANPDLRSKLAATRRELELAINELRDLARGIYPTILTEGGLPEALRSLALRQPESISLQATSQRFPLDIETALYFCCLEAVQNASKHAGPGAHISIRVYARAGELHLEVRDTGPGFDPDTVTDGLGLQSMRDRIGAVGGQIEIIKRPGRGAAVTATVPLHNRPSRSGAVRR